MTITYTQLLKILHGTNIKSTNTLITGVNIFANFIKTNNIYFCINSSKYNSSDGGLGFTNNEDSVYGFGGTQNGHNDIYTAQKNGASVIIFDDLNYYDNTLDIGWILVNDSLQALKQLTSYYIKKNKIKVIAVTGSTGKTTTCQALVDSLSFFMKIKQIHRIRNSVLAMCIEILQNFTPNYDCLIIEMQMDGYGQIEHFCNIAKPDIAIITNINFAHYARFNSMEEILYEKLAVYRNLKPNGFLLINDDNDILHNWATKQQNNNIKKISTLKKCDYSLTHSSSYSEYNFLRISVLIKNNFFPDIKLQTPGAGIIYAALFSLAVADILNFSCETYIKYGLKAIMSPIGRFNCFNGINDSQIIIDSYNASFASMIQGIEYVASSPRQKKILILGSMLELAGQTELQHRELGKWINSLNTNFSIITLGEAAMYITLEISNKLNSKIYCTNTYEDIITILNTFSLDDDTIIFIKGSGAMRMELIAPYLLAKRIF